MWFLFIFIVSFFLFHQCISIINNCYTVIIYPIIVMCVHEYDNRDDDDDSISSVTPSTIQADELPACH